MIGPAAAGVLIATVGTGWVFLINAASFAAVLGSLRLLRRVDLHASQRAPRAPGGLTEGFRTVRARPDLRAICLMLFLVGTFGLNFPIFISTMSVTVFHAGAGQHGLLSSMVAVGSIGGALCGRVLAIRLAIALGGTPIGRPSSAGSPTPAARAGRSASPPSPGSARRRSGSATA